MRAAILAGGKGTRLLEVFPDTPKPMVPFCGKPLLQHTIEMLVCQNIKQITLILGYKAETIKDYFGRGAKYGAEIEYVVEKEPLGSGGALSLLPFEDTLVLMGDLYCEVDFRRFISYHQSLKADITLLVHPNDHFYDSDVVITDNDYKVLDWKVKNRQGNEDVRNCVNAGMFVFDKHALPRGLAEFKNLEHDVVFPMIGKKKVCFYKSTEYVKDIGTAKRFSRVESDIKLGIPKARSLQNRQKAIFVDRDGTVNESDGYITSPEQLALLPGVAQAIKMINHSEYLVICVTNQPVIARGDVTLEELNSIHARLDTLLGREGAYLDDLLFCPHHPDKGFANERLEYKVECECRKPKPGLLLKAARRYNIDLSKSYMIGDSISDMQAGENARCKPILVYENNSLLEITKKILF